MDGVVSIFPHGATGIVPSACWEAWHLHPAVRRNIWPIKRSTSRKPEEISTLSSLLACPYLELFARSYTPLGEWCTKIREEPAPTWRTATGTQIRTCAAGSAPAVP